MGKTIADAAASPAAGIYCRFCSYDLRGQETHRCPECGRGYDPADRKTFRRRPRRRWIRRVILAGILLLILVAAPFGWLYYEWHREQAAVKRFHDMGADVKLKRIDVPVLSKLLPDRYGWILDRVQIIHNYGIGPSPDDLRLAASCRHVEVLSLPRAAVTRAGVEAIAELRHLRCLRLDQPGFDDASAQRLVRVRQLEMLRIDNTSLSDAGLAHLCRLQELKRLSIESPHLTSAGLNALAGLPKLDVLELDCPALRDDALAKLSRLTRLKELHLVGSAFSPAAIERLERAVPNCQVIVIPGLSLQDPPATGPSSAP